MSTCAQYLTQKKEQKIMLRFISTSFVVLAISFVTYILTYTPEAVSLSEVDSFIGKANPKFKCVELCTGPLQQCVTNGVTCKAGNVGAQCGYYRTSKKNHKGCEEDPAGGVDPCVNDTEDICYQAKPCTCVQGLVGTTVVYGCAVPAGAKNQDNGTVTRSKDCS